MKTFRSTACPSYTAGVLDAAPGRQDLLARVFHLEFVAHGRGVRLRNHVLSGVHELGRAHNHRTVAVDHILHVLPRDALIFLASCGLLR